MLAFEASLLSLIHCRCEVHCFLVQVSLWTGFCMPRSLRGSVSIRDYASQLTLCVWSMYYEMPVEHRYMEETVRIQKTEVVVGTVRIKQ